MLRLHQNRTEAPHARLITLNPSGLEIEELNRQSGQREVQIASRTRAKQFFRKPRGLRNRGGSRRPDHDVQFRWKGGQKSPVVFDVLMKAQSGVSAGAKLICKFPSPDKWQQT